MLLLIEAQAGVLLAVLIERQVVTAAFGSRGERGVGVCGRMQRF